MEINWNDATMSTGIESVDKEHKELLRMLTDLMEASSQGKGKKHLGKMMAFLTDYTKMHFASEECIMTHEQCPSAAENKAWHAQFIETLSKLSDRIDREGASEELVILVQQNVLDWIILHIKGCDRQLRQCVQKKNAS